MIYLDNAATTAVKQRVLEAMWPYLTGEFGNPSSTHSLGDRASGALTTARSNVARAIGASPGEIVFTSGGTEADNLGIKGIALERPRGRHIVTSPIEHEAVLASCDYLTRHHGFEVTLVDVTATGAVTVDALERVLRPDTTLVAIMLANNEIGTVQPIRELAHAAHAVGARFHTDAVQAVGALDVDVEALGIDSLALSGHKLGAPKGIGALYLRRGVRLEPVIHGGGQERGRRSGTENVAGAVGLATALAIADEWRARSSGSLVALRDSLIHRVLDVVPTAVVTGDPIARLPGVASFCLPGTNGESVLLELDRRGILSSSGSACAAGQTDPSHVLLAIGFDAATAQTAIRFSLGSDTSEADVDAIVDALRDSLDELSALDTRAAR